MTGGFTAKSDPLGLKEVEFVIASPLAFLGEAISLTVRVVREIASL